MTNPLQLLEKFRARFGTPAAIYRAPGRVNLIGEHTDYNDGFVLPAAIEFHCWVAAAPRGDKKLVIHSENFNETVEASLASISPAGKNHWAKVSVPQQPSKSPSVSPFCDKVAALLIAPSWRNFAKKPRTNLWVRAAGLWTSSSPAMGKLRLPCCSIAGRWTFRLLSCRQESNS